ncbi:hypothetical protein D3C87_1375990 [compost metagenome]|jgi:hypothetical protein
MKWFIVRYVYQIITGKGNHASQFDEQLRLTIAESSEEALAKAEKQADEFHQPFRNHNGEMVSWNFICIADLYEIQSPEDGAEVASTLYEPKDVNAFLDHVNQRKNYLQKLLPYSTPSIKLF